MRSLAPKLFAEPSHKPHRLLILQSTSIFEATGGLQNYLDDFATMTAELYGADAVCSLVAFRGETIPNPKTAYEVQFVKLSANPLVQKLQNRFSIQMYTKALEIIDFLQPTLIVCGHVSLAPLAFMLERARQIPYCVFSHGIESWAGGGPLDSWAFARAKGIFAISDFTKQVHVGRGVPEDKVQVLHPVLAKAYEKLRYVTRRPRKTITLLTVSRLAANEAYKGHDHVLHALAKLKGKRSPKLRYIILGEGDGKAQLEALVAELKLESVVEFRPFAKNRTELIEVYKEADIFVMPSRFGKLGNRWMGEGFGLVYLEAAACGLPSIAYATGGATDFIRDGQNGLLVEPDNIQALTEAIGKLAKDGRLRKNLSKAAFDAVKERFTREALRSQFLRAFDHF